MLLKDWIRINEKLVEWKWQQTAQVSGENLSESHSVHHKFHMDWRGEKNPGPRGDSLLPQQGTAGVFSYFETLNITVPQPDMP